MDFCVPLFSSVSWHVSSERDTDTDMDIRSPALLQVEAGVHAHVRSRFLPSLTNSCCPIHLPALRAPHTLESGRRQTRFRAARTRQSSTYRRVTGPDLSFYSCIEKIVSCDMWICDLVICDCMDVEEGCRLLDLNSIVQKNLCVETA